MLLPRGRLLPPPVPRPGGQSRARGRQPPASAHGLRPVGFPPCFGPERMVLGGLFNRENWELAPFVSVLPFPARIVKNNLLSTYKLVE